MEQLELNVEERTARGSAQARRMRKVGMVPGVVYSDGKDAQAVMISAHEFMMAARGRKWAQIFKFKSRSTSLDGQLALVKDVQMEPLKERILHVDFLSLHEGQQVHVKVQLQLTGEPAAVKEGRGLLIQSMYELELACALNSIPEQLLLDITGLEEGKSLHASDVELPENVQLYGNADQVIVSVVSAKALAEQQAASTTPAGETPPAAAAAAAQPAKAAPEKKS